MVIFLGCLRVKGVAYMSSSGLGLRGIRISDVGCSCCDRSVITDFGKCDFIICH